MTLNNKETTIVALIIVVLMGILIYCVIQYQEREFEKAIAEDRACWNVYNNETEKLGLHCNLSSWDNETNKMIPGNCREKRMEIDKLHDELIVCVGIY